MKPAKQTLFHEELLNMEQVKKDLYKDINDASIRSNIDSAKKRACLQHMDYDNFHQMVLGANLFPVKAGAISNVYNPTKKGFSSNNSFQLIGSGTENEAIVKITLGMNQEDDLKEPRNVAELQKFINERCKDSMQKYTYLRVIGLPCLWNICQDTEFDSELLLEMIKCFQEQVLNNLTFNNEEEQSFMFQWLSIVAFESKGFDFVAQFFTDEEKQIVKQLIDGLDKVDTTDLKKAFEI